MKLVYIKIILLLCYLNLYSAEFPYPIVFIHGLDSHDSTWYSTIEQINSIFETQFKSENIFHGVLNAYPEMTNLAGVNNKLGDNDDDVLFYFQPKSKNNIFTINFDNFWNGNPSNPVIYIYPNSSYDVKTGESKSNQASIVKQGYALSLMMKKLVNDLGYEKVILFGHSMGGLCAREYLQRNENGKPKWWINKNDSNGHHVAKFVTIGTPHFGSNFFSLGKQKNIKDEIQVANTSSEATRDLRYSYSGGEVGRYLFGGYEDELNSLPSYLGGWHNRDVNCNGIETDNIEGINSHINKHPLPQNIAYHWITSNSSGSGDYIVDLDRQWLKNTSNQIYPVGITDTTLTNTIHTKEPNDLKAIIRGLDEPSNFDLAYKIYLDKTYIQTVTFLQDYKAMDYDVFWIDVNGYDLNNKQLEIVYNDKIVKYGLNRKINVKLFTDDRKLLLDTNFIDSSKPNTAILNFNIVKLERKKIFIQTKIEAKENEWSIPINFKLSLNNLNNIKSEFGVSEIKKIFPNPVESTITIPIGINNGEIKWQIFNLEGTCVKSDLTKINDFLQIDVTDLVTGSYYIKIYNLTEIEIFNFLKY